MERERFYSTAPNSEPATRTHKRASEAWVIRKCRDGNRQIVAVRNSGALLGFVRPKKQRGNRFEATSVRMDLNRPTQEFRTRGLAAAWLWSVIQEVSL